jgi:nitrogen fixation NifU-like protein
MSLRELYQEMILYHGKHPRNFGALANANHHHAGYNPVCGDQLMVYVFEHDDKIVDIQFEGTGCAISMASASLMTEAVKGKSLADVKHLFDSFHELVTEGHAVDDLGKLAIFSGVVEFPVRVKCATLAWHTLKAALENDQGSVSTE